ncbi:Uncharacterised protein [Mycobacterium tuberculosis]|nr:Uncharacterised protein [Mycobacterium tuberculosis]CKP80780.1 Uncharacterised protein [Mycobacterium tuberculosis]CKQ97719.1 Uncharacterised protein [Mycobacterium tuberculosis]CKS69224.1 Uncharacterised protein [Mycobacterium tuberculosis]CKT47323.1 Uncharacterised protein [Mycobacterium tuberculosis]
MRCGGLQDQRPGCGSQRVPVGVFGVDTHVGDGVRRTQRQPGIGRDRAAGGQAGHDFDVQVGACDGVHLADYRIHRERIARHQPHHVDTRTGLGGQRLGHIGGIAQRRADVRTTGDYRGRGPAVFLRTSSAGRIAVPGNRLGGRRAGHGGQIRADQRHHRLRYVGIGEHQRGVGQHRGSPCRKQAGVARTGAHENDAARSRLTPSRHDCHSQSLLHAG